MHIASRLTRRRRAPTNHVTDPVCVTSRERHSARRRAAPCALAQVRVGAPTAPAVTTSSVSLQTAADPALEAPAYEAHQSRLVPRVPKVGMRCDASVRELVAAAARTPWVV